MIALGIDVCTGACAVAVVDGDRVLASISETMGRGHVERLAPMVDEALASAGIAPSGLATIAVTTGPGSFTGARLGVSFARGFALASGARAVGVTVFEAIADALPGTVIVALDGRREDLFVQHFDAGHPFGEPLAFPVGEAWIVAEDASPFTIAGSGSDLLLSHAPAAIREAATIADAGFPPQAVARLGMHKADALPPAPLYMRAPDAKPQAVAI